MRRSGPPSEVRRLVAPVSTAFDWAWRNMHWWIALMAILYAGSGITIVKSDEVAVVLRWGRLVGASAVLQQHGPGLLFAFPRPMDQVVRVRVKRVSEVKVTTLTSAPAAPEEEEEGTRTSLNPLKDGYALTGDQNVIQTTLVAHYRVSDPAEWAFYGAKAEDMLRVEVTAAMVRSLGEMGVDSVLSGGRESLIATVSRRTQTGLDQSHAGLQLTSLEVTQLAPPRALASAFDSVQSSFIQAQTEQSDAHSYAESAIPAAQTDADERVQKAEGDAATTLATARGDADAFRALSKEYRGNALVVRERLYRDAVEKAISAAASVRWVPPPPGGKYHGFRISLTPSPTSSKEEEP